VNLFSILGEFIVNPIDRLGKSFLSTSPSAPSSSARQNRGRGPSPRGCSTASVGRKAFSTPAQAGDTFYVATLKGVGRVYQQTVIDTYAKVAFAKLGACPWAQQRRDPRDRKTPITST
jgi:transposase InsO family protein